MLFDGNDTVLTHYAKNDMEYQRAFFENFCAKACQIMQQYGLQKKSCRIIPQTDKLLDFDSYFCVFDE